MKIWNEIVVGLGAVGAATIYNLAKIRHQKNNDVNVLGLEQYELFHPKGSSGGETRATHLANFEGFEYIPLIKRSQEIWRELELVGKKSGLFTPTDVLVISSSNLSVSEKNSIRELEKNADYYNVPCDILSGYDLKKRYPQFNCSKNDRVFIEKSGGFLNSDECISTQIELAKKYGAVVHENECLLEFKKLVDGNIEIKTNRNEYKAKKVFLSLGPWVKNFLGEKYAKFFTLYEKKAYWFEINSEAKELFTSEKFPTFFWNMGKGKIIYGFPSAPQSKGSIKIVTDQSNILSDLESRTPAGYWMAPDFVYENYIRSNLPGLENSCLKTASCIYTLVKDSKFLIDYLPGFDKKITVVSPCSGHGFKTSAAIGEALAQLVIEGYSNIDLLKLFGGVF